MYCVHFKDLWYKYINCSLPKVGGYALAESGCVCHAGAFVTSNLITLLPEFRAISVALDPGRTEDFFYTRRSPRSHREALTKDVLEDVGGGVRIHPENARISGRHGYSVLHHV